MPVRFQSCSNVKTTKDFLECAPCPPPMLTYAEFRDFTLGRILVIPEVCSIARRCRPNDLDVRRDCVTTPPSTTPFVTDRSSSPRVSSSTPQQTTELISSSTNSDVICIVISIGTIVLVAILVCVLYCCCRRRKKLSITAEKAKESETPKPGSSSSSATGDDYQYDNKAMVHDQAAQSSVVDSNIPINTFENSDKRSDSQYKHNPGEYSETDNANTNIDSGSTQWTHL